MGREELSRDDKEQLDYIDWWWEQQEKKKLEKIERRRARRMHLEVACAYVCAAVAELVLIFKDKRSDDIGGKSNEKDDTGLCEDSERS